MKLGSLFGTIGVTACVLAGARLPVWAERHAPDRTGRVVRIEIAPSSFAIEGPKFRQQMVVTGFRSDGSAVDLTDRARFAVTNGRALKVDRSGVAFPTADGAAAVIATVEGLTARAVGRVRNFERPFAWSFENHVEAVLSKQGCNMGICHGAAAGKGGFRLSLRAYDPAADYDRLRYEGRGRRISLTSSGESLLLKKPSLALAHYGGLKLPSDSLEYRVVSDWIAGGAPGVSANTARLVDIEVSPRERVMAAGGAQRLLVTARFADGHREDVTRWARYSSNEEAIATVDESGRATMLAPGETAISVWYLGRVAFARLSVPFPHPVDVARYRSLPRANFIDERVYAKLAPLHLWPSETCSDSEFVRRATLDTSGLLPTPAETRAFLADRSPDKRGRWIESLLERPETIDCWTYRWCDLLRVNRDVLGDKGMWSLYNWIHTCVAENRPWDQVAREVVAAQGVASANGPVNFYRMGSRPEEFAETVSQAFLGIRVQCAHCHNHPFEKWTQNDYYRMSNLFARIGRKGKGDAETIFAADTGDVSHPKLGRPLLPAAFDGPSLALDAPGDRRVFLAKWMTAPENPYFARSFVNRVWKRFMGRGLVEPVDDMRLTNPASNEPLLVGLTQDFTSHGFDMRRLMRTILQSRTYQRSSRPNPTNAADDRFYSHCLPRRLTGEALLDAICQVTERPEKFAGMPDGTRAESLPDTRVASEFLDAFGRPPRQVTCECERNSEPSVAQALHFINARTLNEKVAAKGGVLDRLLAASLSDQAVLEEITLACLCRPPTPVESRLVMAAITAALASAPTSGADSGAPTSGVSQVPMAADSLGAVPLRLGSPAIRKQVFSDMLWALMSGSEFQFNH